MSDQKHPVSRYSVGGSETKYMDKGKKVLKNKKGIADLTTLQIEEEKALAKAYERLLAEVRSDTPITVELIRYAHNCVFSDLYDWAGRWRTVVISKPGATWPPPDYLDEGMKIFGHDVLLKYPPKKLKTDAAFCKAVGHIQGEFLAIHPFREGNARTIKLVTDLLAVQTGRLPLVYDASDNGKHAYIEAAKAAMAQNFDPMISVITKALKATQQSS